MGDLLVCGVVLQTAVALLTNRYINFPLYAGETAESMFLQLWPFIIYFNLIKGAANSVITVLLYKHVSHLFKAAGKHGGEDRGGAGKEEIFVRRKVRRFSARGGFAGKEVRRKE